MARRKLGKWPGMENNLKERLLNYSFNAGQQRKRTLIWVDKEGVVVEQVDWMDGDC